MHDLYQSRLSFQYVLIVQHKLKFMYKVIVVAEDVKC